MSPGRLLYSVLSCSHRFDLVAAMREPERIESTLRTILELYTQGRIKPTVDSVWSFDAVSIRGRGPTQFVLILGEAKFLPSTAGHANLT